MRTTTRGLFLLLGVVMGMDYHASVFAGKNEKDLVSVLATPPQGYRVGAGPKASNTGQCSHYTNRLPGYSSQAKSVLTDCYAEDYNVITYTTNVRLVSNSDTSNSNPCSVDIMLSCSRDNTGQYYDCTPKGSNVYWVKGMNGNCGYKEAVTCYLTGVGPNKVLCLFPS